MPGYYLISGVCSKCLTGTIYNSLLQSCVPICDENRYLLNGRCICSDGLYEIGSECGTCQAGYSYNSYLKNCV